jgi:hypothetical protein
MAHRVTAGSRRVYGLAPIDGLRRIDSAAEVFRRPVPEYDPELLNAS